MSIKKWLKKIPFPITKNHAYDLQAKRVLKEALQAHSNCIDVGSHEGEFMDLFLQFAPQGQHIGFEPLPDFYQQLIQKYPSNCSFHPIALSDKKGETTFNYVISNPAYSGLEKRRYDKKDEKDTTIKVQQDRLDHILPADLSIDFIKIDVEGGELQVLQGAMNTLHKWKPTIIFEHGLGAADVYGTTPEMVFDLLKECGLQVNTMKKWLQKEKSYSKHQFCDQYYQNLDYYFIAYCEESY